MDDLDGPIGTSWRFAHLLCRGNSWVDDMGHATAERFRERAAELFAKAEDFQEPENRQAMKVLAEEYLAMADRLERFYEPEAARSPLGE